MDECKDYIIDILIIIMVNYIFSPIPISWDKKYHQYV